MIDIVNANIKIFVLINEFRRNIFAPSNRIEMNWKIIIWYISVSLLLVAALMTISCVIAFCTPGDESRFPLLLSALLTGIVGAYPFLTNIKG